jgi:pyrophosphatase PpaX
MTIKNIMFDWDGTLAKTLDLWLVGFQKSFAVRDMSFEPREIVTQFFQDHHLVPDRFPDLDFPNIAAEARAHVLQSAAGVDLYDGAHDALHELRDAGVTVSLVTSSPRALLSTGLGAHGLDDFFASTIAGDDGFGHKPEPLPFATTLDRMGANASETLIIGDSHVDILAGQAVGCQTCWFAPDVNDVFHDFARIRGIGADYEVRGIGELVGMV